jgi:hypothetical protein
MEKPIFILFVFFLISCASDTTEYAANDNIDQASMEILDSLENKLLNYLSDKQVGQCKAMLSSEFINSYQGDINDFLFKTSDLIKDYPTNVLDRFHIISPKNKLTSAIKSNIPKRNYHLKYSPSNKESYISLRVLNSVPYQMMVTTIYSKYDSGWKVDLLKVKKYAAHKLTADDLYNSSATNYKEGKIVNAYNEIFLASKLYKPSGKLFYYDYADKMQELLGRILKERKDKFIFPIEIQALSSKPKILNFSPIVTEDGIFSNISYVSSISIADTTALRIENKKIHDLIPTVFEYIKHKDNTIYYQVMNEIPDGSKAVETFSFKQR